MIDREHLIDSLEGAPYTMTLALVLDWIIFVLENLRDEDDEHYEEFLRNLKGAITARLEAGRW